jgi:hypothetical protein
MMDKRERLVSSKKNGQPLAPGPRPNTTTPHTLEVTRDRVTSLMPRGCPNDLVAGAPEQAPTFTMSPNLLNLPNQTPNPKLVRYRRPIDPRVDFNRDQSIRGVDSNRDQSARGVDSNRDQSSRIVDSNQNQSSRVNTSSGNQSTGGNIPSPQPRFDVRSPPITDPLYDKHTNKDDHLNTSTSRNLSSTSSYPGSGRSYQREISTVHKRGVQGGIMGSTERYFKLKFYF